MRNEILFIHQYVPYIQQLSETISYPKEKKTDWKKKRLLSLNGNHDLIKV